MKPSVASCIFQSIVSWLLAQERTFQTGWSIAHRTVCFLSAIPHELISQIYTMKDSNHKTIHLLYYLALDMSVVYISATIFVQYIEVLRSNSFNIDRKNIYSVALSSLLKFFGVPAIVSIAYYLYDWTYCSWSTVCCT